MTLGGHPALQGLTLDIAQGEHCVLLGANGSGKSTLLRVLRGEAYPDQRKGGTIHWATAAPQESTRQHAPGTRLHPGTSAAGTASTMPITYEGEDDAPLTGRALCALVSPAQQELYLRMAWDMTGEELILTGLTDTPLLYSAPTASDRAAAHAVASRLGATALLQASVPALSQGQLRLLLVARALVRNPALLLLDEVCDGLDAHARRLVLDAIDAAAEQGATVMHATHRADMAADLPGCITAGIVLHRGRMVARGPVADMVALQLRDTAHEPVSAAKGQRIAAANATDTDSNSTPSPPVLAPADGQRIAPVAAMGTAPAYSLGGKPAHAPDTDSNSTAAQAATESAAPAVPTAPPALAGGQRSTPAHAPGTISTLTAASAAPMPAPSPVAVASQHSRIALHDVDVYVERAHVLHTLHWTCNANETWAVVGANGSGKSTFLGLLHGEHCAAAGGTVTITAPDGTRIDDLATLRRGVRLVSDRLQATYGYDLTGEAFVLSGHDNTIGNYRPFTAAERRDARQQMQRMGVDYLATRTIRTLSTGQLRRLLLARALVGNPWLLLLDEPCSGLDPASRADLLALLQSITAQGVQLLLVSHHDEDLIPAVTHILRLANGRIVSSGPR